MMRDIAILMAQAGIYYGVMLALFRARHVLGIGTFFCALCALTFAETYLAIAVFVSVGPVIYSPGSVLFFAGKLQLLLLAYIREDAETVRQPIYGLLIGNVLIVVLLVFINMQTPADDGHMRGTIDTIASSALVSMWGTLLLFIDCIAVILLYEKLARTWKMPLFLLLWSTSTTVLTVDHIAFFAVLNQFFDAPLSAGIGGLIGKVVAAGVFSALVSLYLDYIEHPRPMRRKALRDVFGILTYRQRFEALRQESRIDPLTQSRNRRALLEEGPRAVETAREFGTSLSVLVIDIDHFKEINDRYGHQIGDEALRFLVERVTHTVGPGNEVYRMGGDEFLVLLKNEPHPTAETAAEIRSATLSMPMGPGFLSVSVGWAVLGEDGTTLDELTSAADRRLYEVKSERRPPTILGAAPATS